MGNTLVTVPGPESGVLGVESLKTRPKILEKCAKFFGSGTGWEIDLENVSRALRKMAGAEKHGEEARNGPGAGIL